MSNDGRETTDAYRGRCRAIARAEHPLDKATDRRGWTEVSDIYRAPPKATQAIVEQVRHRPANRSVPRFEAWSLAGLRLLLDRRGGDV